MDLPVVSILVITYNSSKTIISTLESVKSQTYDNLELVISDDGSSDNTIDLCRDWLENNKFHFVNTDLVTTPKNTGVPGNCNRAVEAAKGKWIKLIAGDDLLLDNCITDFMCFINDNPSVEIVTSNYYTFIEEDDIIRRGKLRLKDDIMNQFNSYDARKQLYYYLENSINITPSLFYTKDLILRNGGFNEKYRLFEDTPMIVKILLSDIKIAYLSIPTVMYRQSQTSITRTNINSFYKISFVDCYLLFRKDMIYPLYKNNIMFWIKEYSFRFQYYIVKNIFRNKKNPYTKVLYYLIKLLNPYYLFISIKKHLS